MKNTTKKVLFLGAAFCAALATTNVAAYAANVPLSLAVAPEGEYTVSGNVSDRTGEPLIGVNIVIKGTTTGCTTDIDGNYSLKVPEGAPVQLVFTYIGFKTETRTVNHATTLNVVMSDDSQVMEAVVVTAMGILRKETSLTYATQQVKADDLMKVEDPNLVNGLEGKVAGLTLTQGAGGAGGATKITLRGNKSINGNNAPLIVVDGIPISNSTRGQVGDAASIENESAVEGSDPLSQINPDDIESINVLKGANAAALYGSRAANGVVMITTKKGREGKLDVSFTSNVTFDSPLLTPKLQNYYGASTKHNTLSSNSWGPKLGTYDGEPVRNYIHQVIAEDNKIISETGYYDVHLRNYASDDIAEFYRTGMTTNNSVSLSGGTEKVRSYFSYANSYANGMLERNTYSRNTFSFRQQYTLWKRLNISANANYVTTRTKNRKGGGTVFNPIYNLYTTPRNVDMAYYRNNYITHGSWNAEQFEYWNGKKMTKGTPVLEGDDMQNWAYQRNMFNNPYFLLNQNTGVDKEDRFSGNLQANLDIWGGLSAQARVSIDHAKYSSEGHRSATTWSVAEMLDYGHYWLKSSKTNEIYTDYMLMYNKTFNDALSVNASAGYVGHVEKGENTNTYVHEAAKFKYGKANAIVDLPVSSDYNVFMANAGRNPATYKSRSSNWDQAALATVSLGWKDAIYVDGSYRMDWYRAFKQARFISGDNKAKDHYGYWGLGGNIIFSNLFKLPENITYLKYRASYSEVGNSIPNTLFDCYSINLADGTSDPSFYNSFTPKPETMKSFETGVEAAFFNNALNVDVTYYNSKLDGGYLVVPWPNGKSQPVNTTCIRNQGFEVTLAYDWMFAKNWRWKTSVNFSYNDNKILNVFTDQNGDEQTVQLGLSARAIAKYQKGGSYGDIYITDFDRWNNDVYSAEGVLLHKAGDIYVDNSGVPSVSGRLWTTDANGDAVKVKDADGNELGGGQYGKYAGNMNAKYQLSWSNTLSYKNFTFYFLISGRIGGKVLSLTEAFLDRQGMSERTGKARLYAEENNIYYKEGVLGMYINDGRDLVPIQDYYNTIGYKDASNYIYDATNFRLRELSFGYTFRDLFGENRNLALSFIARNLFFIYKDSPVDPDLAVSTGNSLQALECFNVPSSRSFGFNLKVNF